MLETESAKFLKAREVKHQQTIQLSDGKLKHFFKVGQYDVMIWEELKVYFIDGVQSSKQMMHKWSCTCIRGSLIVPTHNDCCKHILAAECWLVMKEAFKT